MTLRVGIVGAGIGGLTAALACRDAGFHVEIFEAAPALEALGAGIQLSANATKVLRALGILDAVAARSVVPEAVHFRDWRTAFLVAHIPLGATSEARYGAPYLHVHRGDLHAVLTDAARARGIPIRLGAPFASLETDERGVAARFGDGAAFAGDVLIGADGIRSAVRTALFGPEAPRFTGNVAWRGLVPTDRLPRDLIARAATAWLGPRRHFVHYYVSSGAFVNLVGVVESSAWTEESWTTPGSSAELAADFAGWHATLHTLIGAADHVFKWALYDRDPLSTWTRGRVTLLGDAAHPMLPFLAQGAASAIEDGWILSRLLLEDDEDPGAALAAYERFRKPRTARMQHGARAQGVMFHEPSPVGRLKRNLRLGLGSRMAPELAMRQLDWIHGYETVRGF
jgi:salicylate hydroxylase